MHNILSTTAFKQSSYKLQAATSRNDSMSDISLPPFGSQNSSFSSLSNTSQTIRFVNISIISKGTYILINVYQILQ